MEQHTIIMKTSSIPAKVLVFGEYITLIGGTAVARPLDLYSTKWTNISENQPAQKPLYGLLDYLKNLDKSGSLRVKCNFEQFENALKNGFWLESTVPQGYGLGSSGAVVAAIYRDFCEKTTDLSVLKTDLAQMESFFHGASSGIDPLICYTEKALVINADKTICLAPAATSLTNFWLIDTEKPRKTEPLVAVFQQFCADTVYNNTMKTDYIPRSETCINAYLNGNETDLARNIFELSLLQYELFKPMIPNFLRPYWHEGLTTGRFCLKLCGAGGGGFMLAYAKNKTDLPAFLQERVRN